MMTYVFRCPECGETREVRAVPGDVLVPPLCSNTDVHPALRVMSRHYRAEAVNLIPPKV